MDITIHEHLITQFIYIDGITHKMNFDLNI